MELERQPKYSVSTTQVNLAIKYTYANFNAAESSSVIVGKNKSYRILHTIRLSPGHEEKYLRYWVYEAQSYNIGADNIA